MAGGDYYSKLIIKQGLKRGHLSLIENTKFMFKNNISEIATKHHGNWYEPKEKKVKLIC